MQDHEDSLYCTGPRAQNGFYRNKRTGGITWGQEDIWDLTHQEDRQD
jgi:hypothetical protein